MAVGMGMTMAPATESVMGSLPREKAGVGSAVNDTTRQVGGALGVAVIGSVVSSIYASNVTNIAASFGVTGSDLAEARASLGGALQVGGDPGFIDGVKDGFVDALSSGLRLSSVIILGAAFVAWRFLPARARDPLAVDVAPVPVAIGRRLMGRPRSADATEAILAATLEQLTDAGAAGLSMDVVAQRAGVGKATIYRRWASKEALVLDALRTAIEPIPVPDEGSLRADLIAYTDELVERFRAGRGSDVLPHLVAASCHDDELRASLDDYVRGGQSTLRLLLRRGIDRGELLADTDVDLAVEAILGPIFYRHLLSGEPVDRALARRLVEHVLRQA